MQDRKSIMTRMIPDMNDGESPQLRHQIDAPTYLPSGNSIKSDKHKANKISQITYQYIDYVGKEIGSITLP